MVEIALAESAAKTAWGIMKPFAVFIACAAIGFIGAEMFEHRKAGPTIHVPILGDVSPFGESLEAKLDGVIAAEPAKVAAAVQVGIQQQTAADAPAFAKWANSLATCTTDATVARDAAAAALTKSDIFTNAQAAQAYKMGKASCGVTNATFAPNAAGGSKPGGVPDHAGPDFADIFQSGAYTAPGQVAVPAGGYGAPDLGTPAPQGH